MTTAHSSSGPASAEPGGRAPESELEEGIQLDFREDMSYADYLHLDEILGAQHPRSQPAAYDELLFIIQHQTSELWLKLMLHELTGARSAFGQDELSVALKRLARVKHIMHTLTDQWSVLGTLTPSEYLKFRGTLASSSGFQSAQYRGVEFVLGNKNPAMLSMFEHDEAAHAQLGTLLNSPSLYDEFIKHLARRGFPVPEEVLSRDATQRHTSSPGLVETFKAIYQAPDDHWQVYETCEELVDLEDSFQFWRFRHLRTVQRVIGNKPGTGGSSGVSFLGRALENVFFPELYEVRGVLEN